MDPSPVEKGQPILYEYQIISILHLSSKGICHATLEGRKKIVRLDSSFPSASSAQRDFLIKKVQGFLISSNTLLCFNKESITNFLVLEKFDLIIIVVDLF